MTYTHNAKSWWEVIGAYRNFFLSKKYLCTHKHLTTWSNKIKIMLTADVTYKVAVILILSLYLSNQAKNVDITWWLILQYYYRIQFNVPFVSAIVCWTTSNEKLSLIACYEYKRNMNPSTLAMASLYFYRYNVSTPFLFFYVVQL